jgi:hypothetical protein
VAEPSQVCSCCRERRPYSHFYRRKTSINHHQAGMVIDFCKWCAKDRARDRERRAQAKLQAQVAAQETWNMRPTLTAADVASVQAHYNSRAKRG